MVPQLWTPTISPVVVSGDAAISFDMGRFLSGSGFRLDDAECDQRPLDCRAFRKRAPVVSSSSSCSGSLSLSHE